MDINDKYIKKIKKGLKKAFEEGKVSKHYSFKSFCNNFIPETTAFENKGYCLCGHDIYNNFKYTHYKRDDTFILGSCCIERFSTKYKEEEEKKRKCIECDDDIRKNKYNLCKECRKIQLKAEKEKEKYEQRCRCIKCGIIKKDDKYKMCYTCKFGDTQKKYINCTQCGIKKKEDTYRKCYKCNKRNRYDPDSIEENIRIQLDSSYSDDDYDPIADNIRVALESWD